MPKHKQDHNQPQKMQDFAQKLSAAYKALQQIIDPQSSGLFNPKFDQMFLAHPHEALEAFKNMLKAVKEHFKNQNNQKPDNYDQEMEKAKNVLKEVKSKLQEIAPHLPSNAKQPMDQILAFIEKLFEMFTKMMAQVQNIQEAPGAKKHRQKNK